MDNLFEKKRHRRVFSTLGWAILIYSLILNACVLLFTFFDMLMISLSGMNGAQYTEEDVSGILMNNGWGYLLAIVAGLLALRLWQGKRFVRETLWVRGRPMGVGDYFCLLALMLSVQMAFSVTAGAMELLFNLFGLSLLESMESATMTAESFSMFLYMGIGAPIAEELLFRGLVLRKLEPYGKRFAIVLSAFLFAIFHGNLVQIPYAFLFGLVLGYTALEHNILWAMVLHMFNNLVLADILTRLTSFLPEIWGNLIFSGVILISAVAALVILIVRGKEVSAYRKANRINGSYTGMFFTSPGIIGMLIFAILSAVAPLVRQMMDHLTK